MKFLLARSYADFSIVQGAGVLNHIEAEIQRAESKAATSYSDPEEHRDLTNDVITLRKGASALRRFMSLFTKDKSVRPKHENPILRQQYDLTIAALNNDLFSEWIQHDNHPQFA